MAFDWDSANIDHIARHRVTAVEAEEALNDSHILWLGVGIERGEWRFEFVGQTAAGRILYVVVTRRGGRIRVVTAYRADRRERDDYLARR